ncbi:MAG: transcription antitermination factor NusB [Planctomycetes bacterium]|jgi:transcription antitermination factor NusB|nr:transcription antitermination factor NusB [Planctomycetota bacterium]
MRRRTRARELALQILYQVDVRGPEILEDLDSLLAAVEAPDEVRQFARDLVTGTCGSREEADRLISEVAEHWDIGRMAIVDRNVLRLAVHEMLHCRDVPVKVAINEAIELGKRYSTGNSGAFINGILDRIRTLLPEKGGD